MSHMDPLGLMRDMFPRLSNCKPDSIGRKSRADYELVAIQRAHEEASQTFDFVVTGMQRRIWGPQRIPEPGG